MGTPRAHAFSNKALRRFFILIVGFLGPLFSSALKTSVDGYLQYRSKQILSADLAVSNQREFKPEEIKSALDISKAQKNSQVTEFVTMAAGRDTSTLIEVQAVDENFPIYGVFEFEDGTKKTSGKELSEAKIAWGFPEILAQLGLKIGDDISIGKLKVKLVGILKDGPGLSRAGGFAPRIYLSRKLVKETGLTQFGSQVAYRLYLQLPKGASAEVEGSAIKEVLADPDIFIRTPDDSTNRLERFLHVL